MERYKSINNYLNMALLESEIKRSKNENKTFSLVLFKYSVDLDNIFLFRNIMVQIHKLLNYANIFYNDKDSFLVMLPNTKLHESIIVFRKVQNRLQKEYDLLIDRVGITEIDSNDTYESAYKRVNRYLVISKRLPIGKIIYGTSSFDFFDEKSREDSLKVIFEKDPKVKLYNFYKGIPIIEQGVVVSYNEKSVGIKTTQNELLYLKKNEEFLYLKHKEFPYIIKGDIFRHDFNNHLVYIKNLEFQDVSIVDRENVRITPTKNISLTVEYQNSIVCNGMIISISVDSIQAKFEKNMLKRLLVLKNNEFITKFKLFTKSSIAVDNISTRAAIFDIIGHEVIFSIKPNDFTKMKIERYIKSIESEIIKNLKKKLLIQ